MAKIKNAGSAIKIVLAAVYDFLELSVKTKIAAKR